MQVSIVAAVARNGVIGKDGKMPWHIPSDLRHFREVTMGKPVIMGRKTYESIGRPLDGRVNIVVTRDPNWFPDNVSSTMVHTAYSLQGAMAIARTPIHRPRARNRNEEAMVIGGGQIYDEALAVATTLHLTVVHYDPEGDTYFPEFHMPDYDVEETRGPFQGPDDQYPVSFMTLRRR
jgi:dihydrofolate reductase